MRIRHAIFVGALIFEKQKTMTVVQSPPAGTTRVGSRSTRGVVGLIAVAILLCAAQWSTAVHAADLGITKSGPGSIAVGATGTFTLAGVNVGPLPLPSNVPTTITDTFPAIFSSVHVTSAPGWNCSASAGLTVSCTTNMALAAGVLFPPITVTAVPNAVGTYQNCAKIKFIPNAMTQPDLVPGNNTSCINVVVHSPAGAPDLAVTKSCVINGPQSVLCTVTVTNIGTAASTAPITLSDLVSGAPSNGVFTGAGGTLPISCSPGAGPILPILCHANTSLAPGQSRNALFSFKLPTGGSFTNCATVTTPSSPAVPGDSNPANNTNICTSIKVPGPSAADLSVTKSCVVNGPHSVLCTVTVTNIGAAPSVSPITLTDLVTGAPSNGVFTGGGGTLPISCSPGAGPILPILCHAATSLAPGQSRNALFSFKLPTGGSFKNCVTVTEATNSGSPGDPNPANNTNVCTSIKAP